MYVFGSAPEDLRKVLLEAYGQKPVKKIVCGKAHCIILLNNNKLIGFGSNEDGQLGLPLETKVCNKVTKLPITLQNIGNLNNIEIKDIAAGDEFSLVLVKNEEERFFLIRFGTDIRYKYVTLPYSTSQSIYILPEEVNNITKIFAFEKRKLFYTQENDIYLGGKDFTGTEINRYIHLKKFDTNILSLQLQKESCIIMDSNKQVYGLGDNSYKELGFGRSYSMNDFHKLEFKFAKSNIKKISSGARHTLFLLENGEVFCVGDNSEGQCCGATSSCGFPIKLEMSRKEKVVDCYAGYNHNLIILSNGSVYTWGNTANGKLGYYEDKFTQDTPREILNMKIKCINNVCLGYQLTVIVSGKEQDSIIANNRPIINEGMNEKN